MVLELNKSPLCLICNYCTCHLFQPRGNIMIWTWKIQHDVSIIHLYFITAFMIIRVIFLSDFSLLPGVVIHSHPERSFSKLVFIYIFLTFVLLYFHDTCRQGIASQPINDVKFNTNSEGSVKAVRLYMLRIHQFFSRSIQAHTQRQLGMFFI